MKNTFYVLILLFNFLNAKSQSIITHQVMEQYYYKNQLYPFNKMHIVFSSVPEADKYYQRFLRRKKAAKISGFTTLGLFAIGGLSQVFKDENMYCDLICDADAFTILAIFGGAITGPIWLGFEISSSVAKAKAIKKFNQYYQQDLGQIPDSIIIGIGSQANGIGFNITF